METMIKVGNELYKLKNKLKSGSSDCLKCDAVDKLSPDSFSCKYRKIFKSGNNLCMEVTLSLGTQLKQLNNTYFIKVPLSLYKILKYQNSSKYEI